MQIVIDIPEGSYKAILNGYVNQTIMSIWFDSVKKGTPLSDVLANIRGDIWDDGVNMTGEYQGVWTRFSDVEKAFDKQMEVNE